MPASATARAALLTAFSLTVISLPVGRRAVAQCLAPDRLIVDVGCWISDARSAVNAPTSVSLSQGGDPCPNYTWSSDTKIAQDHPELEYVMHMEGVGEESYSLEAPAERGKCYTCSVSASGGYRFTPLTASDTEGPACWQVWCLDANLNGICDEYEHTDPDPDPNEDTCPGGPPCSSPLVVDVLSARYEFSGLDDPVEFDIDADGRMNRITWTARNSTVAFVAADRNHNSKIDNGAELFGNWTVLRSGVRAGNGFEALKELDSNGDGIVNRFDPRWNDLLLWRDANHDGVSQPGELQRVAGSGIVGIATEYHWAGRRDASGNLLAYQGWTYLESGARPAYDVYFRTVP